jgi:tetratricopeptide (TPR) repeat protein
MRFPLLLLIFLIKTSTIIAQNYTSLGDAPKKAVRAYEKAQDLEKERAAEQAEEQYKKAIELAPIFIDAHFALAELYYKQQRFEEAKKHYTQTVQMSAIYKPQATFTLGLISERDKKWAEAADLYDAFLRLKRDAELIEKAKQRTAYCRFRATAYANPVPFKPVNMGSNINSGNDEYLPSLSLAHRSTRRATKAHKRLPLTAKQLCSTLATVPTAWANAIFTFQTL